MADVANTADDFWGVQAALASKKTPLAVGSWIEMVSGVEGRDKLLKVVQFYARARRWRCAEAGAEDAAAAWGGLFQSVQEGRKSARVLKGLNKVDQVFTEVPRAENLVEKVAVAGTWLGLALHWHFDYLAHAHRTGFLRLDAAAYARVARLPSFCWSAGNAFQLLLGLATLKRTGAGIAAARAELGELASPSPTSSCASASASVGRRGELEARVRALRAQRFRGWLLVVKALADLVTSANMAGVEARRRFPRALGWCTEGVVGGAGVVSALAVLFNQFPAAKGPSPEGQGWQPLQRQRNAAAAVFALMQMHTLLGNSPAFMGAEA